RNFSNPLNPKPEPKSPPCSNLANGPPMRKILRALRVLAVTLLVLLPWDATSARIPPERLIITPENVRQLKEVGVIGRGWVQGLAWSPDNRVIAVASSTGVWLYDANDTEKEPRQLPIEYFDPTENIKFSPDGSRLVTVEY